MPSSYRPKIQEHSRYSEARLPSGGNCTVVEPITPIEHIYDKDVCEESNGDGILTDCGARLIITENPLDSNGSITYGINFVEFNDASCRVDYDGRVSAEGKLTGTYNEHNLDTIDLMFVSDTDGPAAA